MSPNQFQGGPVYLCAQKGQLKISTDAENKSKMTSSSVVSPGGGTGGREAGTCLMLNKEASGKVTKLRTHKRSFD